MAPCVCQRNRNAPESNRCGKLPRTSSSRSRRSLRTRRSLRDLISAGPGDVSMNARLLYAFWVLHLVARREILTGGIKKIQWKTGSGNIPAAGGGSAG